MICARLMLTMPKGSFKAPVDPYGFSLYQRGNIVEEDIKNDVKKSAEAKEALKAEERAKKAAEKAKKKAEKDALRSKKMAEKLAKKKEKAGGKEDAPAKSEPAAIHYISPEANPDLEITEDTILVVNNLTKVFHKKGQGEFTAVDHVSFTLNKGECLGIVGESGSGKSTIVKMITRLLDATEGTVTLNGKDVTYVKGRDQRELYKNIQMVFQMPFDSFDPRHNLGSGVGESLRNAGMSKEDTKKKVAELLEMCGLDPEFAARYPHQVSGGQCQRAAIARAIAIEPEILICDEATSSLDVTVQKQILSLLKDLRKKLGMSYLFISHDLAVVQQLCDKVIVLYKGKIVERGTPDEVIANPKDPYTRNLVASVL